MKRSVRFADDTKKHDGGDGLEPTGKKKRVEVEEDIRGDEGDGVERFDRDKKHTLDSDEEYEEENYKKLDMRRVSL